MHAFVDMHDALPVLARRQEWISSKVPNTFRRSVMSGPALTALERYGCPYVRQARHNMMRQFTRLASFAADANACATRRRDNNLLTTFPLISTASSLSQRRESNIGTNPIVVDFSKRPAWFRVVKVHRLVGITRELAE